MLFRRLILAVLLGAALVPAASGQESKELSAADMALGFYQPLAEEGSPYAQLVIGEMYMEGNGVPQDYVTAYAWLAVSAHQGVEEAVPVRDQVWDKLSVEQREQANGLAGEFIRAYVP